MRDRMVIAGFVALALASLAQAREPTVEQTADGLTVKTEYHDSGQVRSVTRLDAEGRLVSAEQHSPEGRLERAEEYDPQGRMRLKTEYDVDGRPSAERVYAEDGALQSLKEFDSGSDTVAKLSIYGPHQRLVKELRFKHGKPQNAREYYADGALRTEHLYDADGREWKVTEYYPNGEVDSTRYYTEMGLESRKTFQEGEEEKE